MSQIIVMVEEPSMEIVAKAISGKLGFSDRTIVIPHQGKTELESSFPKKLNAWSPELSPKFIVCRDNDGGNCRSLKERLTNLIPAQAKHPVKFRIVIQELESWYLGDMKALEQAGLIGAGEGARLARKGKFRTPENLTNAKQEFIKLVKQKGQLQLARKIAPHLDLKSNTSPSFVQFVNALNWASQI
jgi:hypothetical protein